MIASFFGLKARACASLSVPVLERYNLVGVVLATFYMFLVYPLHGIELTEQGVLLGD